MAEGEEALLLNCVFGSSLFPGRWRTGESEGKGARANLLRPLIDQVGCTVKYYDTKAAAIRAQQARLAARKRARSRTPPPPPSVVAAAAKKAKPS